MTLEAFMHNWELEILSSQVSAASLLDEIFLPYQLWFEKTTIYDDRKLFVLIYRYYLVYMPFVSTSHFLPYHCIYILSEWL